MVHKWRTPEKQCAMCGNVIPAGRHVNTLYCDKCRQGPAKITSVQAHSSTADEIWRIAIENKLTIPQVLKIIIDSFVLQEAHHGK